MHFGCRNAIFIKTAKKGKFYRFFHFYSLITRNGARYRKMPETRAYPNLVKKHYSKCKYSTLSGKPKKSSKMPYFQTF